MWQRIPFVEFGKRLLRQFCSFARFVSIEYKLSSSRQYTLSGMFGIAKASKDLNNQKIFISEADELYNQQKYVELQNFLENQTNNDELLWRLSRAIYENAKSENVEKRKNMLKEAMNLLENAEKMNPNNFAIHKWQAIIKDAYYTLIGTKARIEHLYEIKCHMEKACELNPLDGTSWHVLGMWYFGIANLSWLERKAGAIFFATPPQATFQEALDVFMKAEDAEPNFYGRNYLMIAKCLIKIGNKEEGKKYLNKAKEFNAKTEDDKDAQNEAFKLLS